MGVQIGQKKIINEVKAGQGQRRLFLNHRLQYTHLFMRCSSRRWSHLFIDLFPPLVYRHLVGSVWALLFFNQVYTSIRDDWRYQNRNSLGHQYSKIGLGSHLRDHNCENIIILRARHLKEKNSPLKYTQNLGTQHRCLSHTVLCKNRLVG